MMMVMMGCFILHKTWNISTLFTLCACWEEYFCTAVAEHCFLCYYQKERVGLLVEELMYYIFLPSFSLLNSDFTS